MQFSLTRGVVTLAAVAMLTSCHAGHDHDAAHSDEKAATESDHAHEADEIRLTAQQAREAGVKVAALQPSDFAEIIKVSGQVLPAQGTETTIAAPMAGIVQASAGTRLAEGEPVRSGQVLFTLDAAPMAEGNPAAAAQAELAAARAALKRAESLAGERIVSQRELDDTRQRAATAEAQARSLGSASQKRNVSAPVGGYLKELLVSPGSYVAAGQPLAILTQNRRLQLRADVPERHYQALPRITSANFRTDYEEAGRTYSLQELGGRLVSRGQAAGAGDFFVPLIFEFNNAGGIIPGSYAEIYLQGATRKGVLAVPVEALTEAGGMTFVYVQSAPDAYRRVEVKTGASDGRRTEIAAGLHEGDKVVVQGAAMVRLAANATAVPEGHSH